MDTLPHAQQFLDEFTPQTKKTYQQSLLRLGSFLQDYHRHIVDWKPKDVAAWRDSLLAEGLTPSGVALRISTLRSYVKFLVREELAEERLMLAVASVPVRGKTTKLKLGLSREQQRQLLDSIPLRSATHRKMYALTVLLLETGLRIQEALSLRIEQLEKVDSRGGKALILGKGRKEREVFFSNETYAAIISTLSDRGLPAMGWVFQSGYAGKETPISSRYAQQYLSEAGAKVGLEVTPHTLRHTFATNALQVTQNITQVQHLMGHSHIGTTQNYVASREAMNLSDVAFSIMENNRIGATEERWK